jgi:hypothetical protein
MAASASGSFGNGATTKSRCQAMKQQLGQRLRQLRQNKPAAEFLGDCR